MHNIDDIVEITGDTDSSTEQITSALQRITDFPEVVDRIKAGNEKHGQKLLIQCTSFGDRTGYYPKAHIIQYIIDKQNTHQWLTEEGEEFSPSIERTLAHEIAHTTQDYTSEDIEKHDDACYKTLLNWDHSYLDFEKYRSRFNAAGDDREKVAQVFADMYETDVRGTCIQLVKENPVCAHYFDSVEAPAMEFENAIAAKLGEPIRKMDYLESVPGGFDDMFGRENFIESATDSYFESKRQREQSIKPKDPNDIRPDAPTNEQKWNKGE